MNIRLISQDNNLIKLCREIRSDFAKCPWHLFTGPAEEDTSTTDLYIWDFDPAVGVPPSLRRGTSNQLFLVSRKDVAVFQKSSGYCDAVILLKPVTRPTLAAFLGQAVAAYADRLSAADGLRADRDEILQCLIQANLKLQEFDQDRTNFLARALHDFRAPLTAIAGYCDLLVNEALGPLRENQKEVLQKMSHSSRRLSRMASGMYQLSIGRHVHVRIERRESDIQQCIEQAVHEVRPAAEAKDISISTDLDPETTLVYLEPSSIEQVLINILDNACKFTPRSGEIEIRGGPLFWEWRSTNGSTAVATERRKQNARLPNAYRIEILNSGAPIPEEHLAHIFEEYTPYSGGQDRSGGGLGLAICRMIITRHEGRILVENRDSGPVFSFVLPLRRESEPIEERRDKSGFRGRSVAIQQEGQHSELR